MARATQARLQDTGTSRPSPRERRGGAQGPGSTRLLSEGPEQGGGAVQVPPPTAGGAGPRSPCALARPEVPARRLTARCGPGVKLGQKDPESEVPAKKRGQGHGATAAGLARAGPGSCGGVSKPWSLG